MKWIKNNNDFIDRNWSFEVLSLFRDYRTTFLFVVIFCLFHMLTKDRLKQFYGPTNTSCFDCKVFAYSCVLEIEFYLASSMNVLFSVWVLVFLNPFLFLHPRFFFFKSLFFLFLHYLFINFRCTVTIKVYTWLKS